MYGLMGNQNAAAGSVACTPDSGFANCTRITYSGGDQTFTVPANVTSIKVKMWGAGGAGVDANYYPNQSGGGAGGYTTGTIAVTPGQVLTVVVGQGGILGATGGGSYGGGGAGGSNALKSGSPTNARGSSGGGMSALFLPGGKTAANALLVSGGGGGASPGADTPRPGGNINGTAPFAGGGGGSTGGADTVNTAISGQGGTQSAGGASPTTTTGCIVGSTAGSQFQGGPGSSVAAIGTNGSEAGGNEGGGGGGGGWFGGGGGKCQGATSSNTTLSFQNSSGGGGSSYIGGTGVTSASTIAGGNGVYGTPGQGGTAANNTDTQYVSGIANGGTSSVAGGGTGGNGMVVIQYNVNTPDLTLAKSHTGSFTVGSTGTYSFTVNNIGTLATSGTITVTDTLPTGLTVNGGAAGAITEGGTDAANWTCTSNGSAPQTITCTSSTAIAISGSNTFDFPVNVGVGTAVGTNSITNTASVSGGGQTNTANDSASDPTTVLSPNLTISKTHTPTSFVRGSTGTYNITVSNSTGTAATSGTITVTDTLPTGLTITAGAVTLSGTNSTDWSCTAAGQTITCTSSTALAIGGTSTFGFNVNVASGAAASVTNNVSVSGGTEATANNGNNTGTDATPTIASPDLRIAKSHASNFTLGGTGTYSFTVSNTSATASSGTITVTDTLPNGLTVNGGASGGITEGGTNAANWTCTSNATNPQTITCTSATVIAANGSSTFNFTVNVGASTAIGTNSITNTAAVSGGGENAAANTNNSSSDPTTVVAYNITGTLYLDANLNITFDGGETTLPANISVILFNDANSNYKIDTGETIATTTTNASGAYTFTNVAPGTYKVRVDTADIDIPTNYVWFSKDIWNKPVTVSTSNITGINFAFVTPNNVSAISGSCSAQGGTTGSNLFTLGNFGTVSSTTPGTSRGSGISQVPAGFTYANFNGSSFAPNDGFYTIVNKAVKEYGTDSGSSWSDQIPPWHGIGDRSGVANGAVGIFNATITPSVFYQETLTVTANTNYDFSGWIMNLNTPSYQTLAGARLKPNLVFEIQRVGVDAGFVTVAATGDITETDRPTWYQYGTVINSGTATQIIFRIRNNANGGAGNDLALDDLNLSSCQLTADAAITKTGTSSANVGQAVSYTIDVTNAGPANLVNATITDNVPANITGVTWTCTATGTASCGTASGSGNSISLMGSVNSGSGNKLTIAVSGTASTAGNITNTATVIVPTNTTDSNSANNTSSQTTNIGSPDLTITKSHIGNFTRGSTGTYTMTVNNIGGGASSGTITVSDTLPTGLSVANGALTLGGTNSANWSCSAASNVITCTSSTAIATSGSSVFTFNVNVASNAPLSVTNTATVSGGGETNTANNSSSDVTSIPQANFGTCDSRMFLSQAPNTSTNTTLYNIDTSANPFTYPAIAQGSTNYNSMGFNPNDFYLYAIENFNTTGNNLIRIGADGSTINLGAVTGLPVTNYNNGEIGSNGILYVRPSGSSNLMYAINLSTLTATTITTSSSFTAVDLAWMGGKLYTVVTTTGQLISIDPATGTVTNIGAPTGAIQFGAMYGAPNGLFGNANNGSGFYQIDLLTGAQTLISSSPGAQTNDGAHCVNANITFPADIAVTKTDGKTSYTAGSTNVYTITATNNGPFGAQNVTVADPLPSGITTASWTCSATGGGTCAASGTGAINDATVDLPNGATVTYTMTMTVPAGFTGSLTNTATVTVGSSNTDPTPGNNSATDTDAPSADLTIAKSHTGDFTRGSTGTYTMTVNNIGAGSTSGTITVVDTLPTGLSVADGALTLGGTNAANWGCNATNNVITCTSSTAIAASGSSVFTFSVNVASNAPLSVTNTATVSGGGQTNTANDSSSDVTSIPQTSFGTCDSRMYLSQAPTNSTNTTLYNINTSANPLTFPAIAQGSTAYNAIGYNPTDNYIYGIQNVSNSGNSLIRIGADGSTVNLGVISGLPVGNYIAADIGSNGVYYVKSGSTTLYAINISTLTATSITLSPGINGGQDIAWVNGMLYTDVGSNGQLYSINPTTGATATIGAPVGSSYNFGALYGSPTALYGNDNNGTGFYQIDLTNGNVTKISDSPGAQTNDGAHCVNSPITFPADASIAKTDGQTNYSAGSSNVYTITVTNNGPFGIQNSTVSDPLPSGITTASWTCAATGGGTCAASGTGAINDSTVDLPIGAVATYTLTMTVPAGFTGNLVNTATVTVSSSNTDPTSSNNSASDTDTAGLPNVGLVKSCPSPANCTTAAQNPGTDVTYNIAFTNSGGSGAQNVTITDPIPANTDFKLGTATTSLGTTGLTMVVEYSSDYNAGSPGSATWTYTPVSAGGGASAGYDRNVKAVRWRATAGILSNVSPNNTGSVSFVTKIRQKTFLRSEILSPF